MFRSPVRTLFLALLLTTTVAQAQRIAFVDTKYILGKLPEYEAAQQELDRFSTQWQKEIEGRYEQIKRLRDAYNAEAILLTDEMKRTRTEEIEKKEREARDLQKKRFGPNGDLFKKRQELIQPIQDRIYQAVKEVAGTSYVAIFDIGSQSNNILFASDKYDKSDSVLRKLGVRPDRASGSGNTRGNEDDDYRQDDPVEDKGGEQPPPRDGGRDNSVKPPR